MTPSYTPSLSLVVKDRRAVTRISVGTFGYEWRDKKLVVQPKEAPVRRLMYELFLKHRRKKTVVRALNDAGHRTRNGSHFTSKTVTRLKGIHRGNYTTRNGQTNRCALKPESEWVLHEVEALVSTEIWWLTQMGFPWFVGLMGWVMSEEQADIVCELVPPHGRLWAIPDGDDSGKRCAASVFERVGTRRFIQWLRLDEEKQPTDYPGGWLRERLGR